ncbi:hypothetical protein PFISCL1PPCAC_7862, partial [Pristionchus fissidentatus]
FRFRSEGGDNYEQIKEIKCENGKYVVYDLAGTNTIIASDDDVDVRCVADAEYFCDYDLKYTNGKQALSLTKPDLKSDIPKKGKIECPDTHPFLVIRGERPIVNPEKIECRNYGGKMKWTYNKTILSKTSPTVHCVDKLECHVMNTIQKSNLHGSFLNEQFLPTCQDGGKLTVKQGEEESDVIHTTCNGE